MWRGKAKLEVTKVTTRAQLHRLVDALPDDALDAVERRLTELLAATEGRSPIAASGAAEGRLRSFFRRFDGRSLADELIAERREEARGAPISP